MREEKEQHPVESWDPPHLLAANWKNWVNTSQHFISFPCFANVLVWAFHCPRNKQWLAKDKELNDSDNRASSSSSDGATRGGTSSSANPLGATHSGASSSANPLGATHSGASSSARATHSGASSSANPLGATHSGASSSANPLGAAHSGASSSANPGSAWFEFWIQRF